MAVKKNTLLIVAGSLLILLLIGVTILLISEKQTNKELVSLFLPQIKKNIRIKRQVNHKIIIFFFFNFLIRRNNRSVI